MHNLLIHRNQLFHEIFVTSLITDPLFEKTIKILPISRLRVIQVIESLSISFQSRLQRVIGFDR